MKNSSFLTSLFIPLVISFSILMPITSMADDYTDLPRKSHYYSFDLSEAKVDYRFMLNDFNDLFTVTDKEFSNFDKLVLVFTPFTSVEVKLVIANPAYPLSGTCLVGGNECSSKRARPRLAELNSFLASADSTSMIIESVVSGFQDIFIENSSYLEPTYYEEVLQDDTQENYNGIFEWFMATQEPDFYELSLDPSRLNEIFPDGLSLGAQETRGGEILIDIFGESFQTYAPENDFVVTLGGIETIGSVGFADLHQYGPLWDPSAVVRNIGEATYLGTIDDFPCADPDGDGWGWVDSILESCRVKTSESVDPREQCIDSDGDGWGWIEASQSSCRIE